MLSESMTPRTRRYGRRVAVFGVVSILCSFAPFAAPSRATAQSEAPESDGPSQVERDDVLAAAIVAYDAGRLVEARRLFRAAHELAPNARTLRGLGVVSHALGDYLEANAYLAASLVHPVRPLTAELRALVERLLADARTHLGCLRVVGIDPSIELRVDGSPPDFDADGCVYLLPGSHEVRAERSGTDPFFEDVVVAEGATSVVDRSAARLPEPVVPVQVDAQEADAVGAETRPPNLESEAAATTIAPEVPSLERSSRSSRVRRHRVSSLSLLAVGGALAVTAATTYGIAYSRFSGLEDDCRAGCAPEVIEGRIADARLRQLLRTDRATLGLALAATATSGLVWLARPRGEARDSVAIGIGVIAWRRQF